MSEPQGKPSAARAWLAGLVLSAAALLPGRSAPAAQGAVHAPAGSERTYEVMLPAEANALSGAPVVMYLHAAAFKSFDRVKADYWPMLHKRKCLLVLPQSSSTSVWPAGEDAYLNAVLADVRKRYGTDPKRVILMGVSGGAQMALFLADRWPKDFRAVIVISSSPVVVRDRKVGWFYPNREVLKACPYFVVNHITQGSSLKYWRQVRQKLAPSGASISILPVLGPVAHYVPAHASLPAWVDAVLAGKHPAALPDPQKAAVAKMFAACVKALRQAVASARPARAAQTVSKDAAGHRLTAPLPAGYVRAKKEDEQDAGGRPLAQICMEHEQLPIYVRCEAYDSARPMAEMLATQEARTRQRGMLYQVYHTGKVASGKRAWDLKVGSITYPDRTRGWVSPLFLHATGSLPGGGRRWQAVMIMDERMAPDAKGLAELLVTLLDGQQVRRLDTEAAKAAKP